MTKFAVMLDKFGHDTNGNPIARHTVFQYAKADQALDAPSAELYQTRVRQQVGSCTARDEWAGTALAKAKVTGVTRTGVEGDRSSGTMWLIYG